MSPRRPPQHQLPRGLVWKSIGYGVGAYGDPMTEWAYRTPAVPDGLTVSALRRMPELEQAELAEYWFRLNFVPLKIEAGGAAYGMPSAGPGGYVPSDAMAINHLNDEFAEVLPSEVIVALSHRLHSEANWWTPIPPESSPSTIIDPAAVARVALERVEADLERVGLGHNQGPPLDPAIAAEIREQVRLGIGAVEAGADGKDAGRSALARLRAASKFVGDAAVKVAVGEQVKELLPGIKHSLAVLFDHLLQAAAALAHWLATLPLT